MSRQPGFLPLGCAIGCAGIALVFLFTSLAFWGYFKDSALQKPTGEFGVGRGCYLADIYFSDTAIADQADSVFEALSARYPRLKEVRTQFNLVMTMGKSKGINPAIALATWNGETSFRKDLLNGAFGYAITDSGDRRGQYGANSFERQLELFYGSAQDAVNAKGNYTKPPGTNTFTRLYYNYTTAMRLAYEQAGNQWVEGTSVVFRGTTYSDPVGARLGVVRLVVPHQVDCEQASTLVASSSIDGVPVFRQTDYRGTPYGNCSCTRADGSTYRATISTSGCGPVSAAMILSYYGKGVDPVQAAQDSVGFGTYACCQGTNHSYFQKAAQKYGLEYRVVGTNWNEVKRLLAEEKPLLARGQDGKPYTKSGHFIVISGYNSSNNTYRVINTVANLGEGELPASVIERLTTHIYYIGTSK
jgi:hypothetical protein